MSGHRHAALVLHAVAPAEQELILAELPGPDAALLRSYLDELAALGFAPGAGLADSQPDDEMAGAAADQVRTALANEPAALIAACLALEPWSWTSALLARLSPPRRQRVEAARLQLRPGPARDAFLRAALARKLDRPGVAVGVRPPVPQPGLLERIWNRWTR